MKEEEEEEEEARQLSPETRDPPSSPGLDFRVVSLLSSLHHELLIIISWTNTQLSRFEPEFI